MSASESSLLRVEGVDVHYGKGLRRKQVLHQVSFRLGRGEALGVIGETGSGKSTLARAILGLVTPSAGTVTVDGRETTAFGKAEWLAFRRSGIIQYVFQDPLRSLDAAATVGFSVAEPLLVRGGIPGREAKERVRELMEQLNLDADLADRFPGELSGGQRQRVAIARALITEPQVLILDEPVSALDSANRVQILEILGRLRQSGVSLLFISHDLGSVAGITDRTLVLYRGQVVEDNATADVVNDPQHPYTQLLVGSAPTLSGGSIDKARREELRAALHVG
jgi:ABC-type glutathione transport system ATPase component